MGEPHLPPPKRFTTEQSQPIARDCSDPYSLNGRNKAFLLMEKPHTTFRCYSAIGKRFYKKGPQELSLGRNCGHISIVLHEMLHALGKTFHLITCRFFIKKLLICFCFLFLKHYGKASIIVFEIHLLYIYLHSLLRETTV